MNAASSPLILLYGVSKRSCGLAMTGHQNRFTATANAKETAAAAPTAAAGESERFLRAHENKNDLVMRASGDDPLSAFSGETNGNERPFKRPRQSVVRQSMLGVVAAFAVLEAALIGYWMYAGPGTGSDGLLRVTSRPPGGTVTIDGMIRGTTPLAVSLRRGGHRVEIRTAHGSRELIVPIAAGGEFSQDFDLTSAGEPVSGVPAPLGSLEVTTEPPGASISVDGVSHGVTPLRLTDLPDGPHQIILTNAGESVTRQVIVQAATTTTLLVPMIRSTVGLSGWVQISSPVVAQLYEGGRLLGTTETDRVMLPVGRHEIDIVNRALDFSMKASLQVLSGKTTDFDVKVPNGSLYLNALPWADVWIDGQRAGETPLANVSLPIGTHEVLFRHPQLGEQQRTVIVKSSGTTRIGVELGK